eukprot:augustus_masked-scaffold_1-processed-gene-28.35-mRNA-1 protein AED:0.45 eAED:0.45 QI:0/-1/0/1/-1/1/1/0/448
MSSNRHVSGTVKAQALMQEKTKTSMISTSKHSSGELESAAHPLRKKKSPSRRYTRKKSMKGTFKRTLNRTKLYRNTRKNLTELELPSDVRPSDFSGPADQRTRSWNQGKRPKGSIANSKVFEGEIVSQLNVDNIKPLKEFDTEYETHPKILGEGSFAKVWLARMRGDGMFVAAKSTKRPKRGDNEGERLATFKQFVNEVNILTHLRQHDHPNILKIFDTYHSHENEEIGTMLFTTEFVNGTNLAQYFKHEDPRFTSEPKIKVIFHQIASALEYCRTQGVVHRDIKPDNIMICVKDVEKETIVRDTNTIQILKTQEINIKLIDFNLATKMSEFEVGMDMISGACGTFHYMSPEMHMGYRYSFKTDVWSFGVCLFYCLSQGYLPFESDKEESMADISAKVKLGTWRFHPAEKWKPVSRNAKSLVVKVLEPKPAKRYTYEQILEHKYFSFE